MNRYSPATLILWALTIGGSALVGFRMRRVESSALRALRLYLCTETAVEAIGFLCVAFGSPWAYYREYIPAQIIDVAAQCILLSGVWRSFFPRLRQSRLSLAWAALIVLSGTAFALAATRSISGPEVRHLVLMAHLTGYSFCLIAFSMSMLAFACGCTWEPAAARSMIGYLLTTAAVFGVQQSQEIAGHFRGPLMHLVPVAYIASLLIWNSSIPLDKPRPFSPEEVALLERSLEEATGRIPVA